MGKPIGMTGRLALDACNGLHGEVACVIARSYLEALQDIQNLRSEQAVETLPASAGVEMRWLWWADGTRRLQFRTGIYAVQGTAVAWGLWQDVPYVTFPTSEGSVQP